MPPLKKPVAMTPVKSSNIEAVGHDGKDLFIDFRYGGKYAYHDVPVKLFHQLLKAPSIGSFFHRNIKGKHKFTKAT